MYLNSNFNPDSITINNLCFTDVFPCVIFGLETFRKFSKD